MQTHLRRSLAAVLLSGAATSAALSGDIDHGLEPVLQATPAGETISTLIFLNDQVDIDRLNAQLDLEHAKLGGAHLRQAGWPH